MAVDLSELAGLGAATVEVTVRGRPWVLRALTDLETAQVAAAFVTPKAPLVRDPTRGSLAAPVPDYQDHAFRNATRNWNADVQAARVAVAMGLLLAGDGRTWEQVRGTAAAGEWLAKAALALRSTLSDAETEALAAGVDRAGKAGVMPEPPGG